jgi:hypothetical protein
MPVSLGSSKYNTVSPTNRDNLTSFPIYILFVSSHLIALAKNLSAILNNHEESAHFVYS